jgi:hypothetical protein
MRSCRNISGNWDVSIAKFRVVVIRPEPLLSAKVTSHKPPITNPANFLEPCFRRLAVGTSRADASYGVQSGWIDPAGISGSLLRLFAYFELPAADLVVDCFLPADWFVAAVAGYSARVAALQHSVWPRCFLVGSLASALGVEQLQKLADCLAGAAADNFVDAVAG